MRPAPLFSATRSSFAKRPYPPYYLDEFAIPLERRTAKVPACSSSTSSSKPLRSVRPLTTPFGVPDPNR